VPTAPSASCGDTSTSAQNCGACGLSCGATSACGEGRCAVDPPESAPYRLERSYFVAPLAFSAPDDRLLFREDTGLWEAGLSGDPLSPKKIAGTSLTWDAVGTSITRQVYSWKSARYASADALVVAIASVAQDPEAYPADRVLASFDRATGQLSGARVLVGNHDDWDVQRRPAGGLTGAVDTHDAPVVFAGATGPTAAVWEYDAPSKGVALRGFALPLSSSDAGTLLIPARYNLGRVVTDGTSLFYPSKAADSAPWKLKRLGGTPSAGEVDVWSGFLMNPVDLAIVGDQLFVLDGAADPATGTGLLLRFDLRAGCGESGPSVVAKDLVYPAALAADATRVYVQEVRPGTNTGRWNVVTRRFHDGTGSSVIVTEQRGPFPTDPDDERVERLQKGMFPVDAYGQELLVFGLGTDPADYRGPLEFLLGVPR
jgi:hypothetical protein